MSLSPAVARVMCDTPDAPVYGARGRDARAMLLGCDLSGTIDGSMPHHTERVTVGPPTLRVTTHTKRFGTVEVRVLHETHGRLARVGTLNIPRTLWLTVYRRMLLWACGEGIVRLTLDEHAGPTYTRTP